MTKKTRLTDIEVSNLDRPPNGFWYKFEHAKSTNEHPFPRSELIEHIVKDIIDVVTLNNNDKMKKKMVESILEGYFEDLLEYARMKEDENV